MQTIYIALESIEKKSLVRETFAEVKPISIIKKQTILQIVLLWIR